MVDAINNFILNVLNPISIVLGVLVVLVPIFWTWYEVIFGRKKRQQLFLKEIKTQTGERPAVLVVDFKPDSDILNQVLQAREREDLLKNVPEERIFHLQNDSWLKPGDMMGLVEKLRIQLGEVAKAGTDVLYFIYAGPVMPAAIIGAELANSCRVVLFQYQQGEYVNWGVLRHR